ncbi:MAG: hypothetical protein Q4C49_05710 [Bacillota bacterium]|nr:hypothetical protein [Bacillota bacterium]
MSDEYGLIRKRRKTLLIVEGKHEKNELFWLIFKCFPELQIKLEDVWIYGTNIYLLYDDIEKEYDKNWDMDDIDLPFIVSRKLSENKTQSKRDFVNIFLVFDYERHDPKFSEDKIFRLQKYFSDSTDVGQLYINYPMIESYQDLPVFPNSTFLNHKISVQVQPGKVYKNMLRNSLIAKMTGLPKKLRELLNNRYGIKDEVISEQLLIKILSLEMQKTFISKIIELLIPYIGEEKSKEAATMFHHILKKYIEFEKNKSFLMYSRSVLNRIIQYQICKADRIVTNDDRFTDYLIKYKDIDYQSILSIQNRVSSDEEAGFIWVLNTCVLLVPEYNLNLIKSVS